MIVEQPLPLLSKPLYDARAHYSLNTAPTDEFEDASETTAQITNVGWTLGNDCPYRCKHCYSFVARDRGVDMSKEMADRIIGQFIKNNIKTVNLGGNEPIFTNGKDVQKTLLSYIIHRLSDADIKVGITTSGISVIHLYHKYRDAFNLLNDVDVSIDSPIPEEHNHNRGADLYNQALKVLEICQKEEKPHSCIMTGMNWNFTEDRLNALVDLARNYDAYVRINPVKPVEPRHMEVFLEPDQYWRGFALLSELCRSVDLGEPPLAAAANLAESKRCPCGRSSFRVHSPTPDGQIYLSPCVYLHDFKSSLNLLEYDLNQIVNSDQFKVFRQRHAHPEMVKGCAGCSALEKCGGGCASRSYLYSVHTTGEKTMMAKDPYCLRNVSVKINGDIGKSPVLVHSDYLCTWIGQPR